MRRTRSRSDETAAALIKAGLQDVEVSTPARGALHVFFVLSPLLFWRLYVSQQKRFFLYTAAGKLPIMPAEPFAQERWKKANRACWEFFLAPASSCTVEPKLQTDEVHRVVNVGMSLT